ncbi:MAG TPA: hypothetical protein VG308_00455 [Stellaceae bacterium]|jgi:hypothetical protein|nr:hypothetical protein [Stellaceae bacterium]
MKLILCTLAAVLLVGALSIHPADAACYWNGWGWHCWHPYYHSAYWHHPYWHSYWGWHHHWHHW